ncbi:hypothetical protein SK128_020824, partial [Halocaridina rubra]
VGDDVTSLPFRLLGTPVGILALIMPFTLRVVVEDTPRSVDESNFDAYLPYRDYSHSPELVIMKIKQIIITTLIVYVMIIVFTCIAAKQGDLWSSVKIAYVNLNLGSLQQDSMQSPQNTFSKPSPIHICHIYCSALQWCNVWCIDPSSDSICYFYELYVVSGYQETSNTNVYSCYTRSPKDYAIGATIEGSPPHPTYPNRMLENLIDGFYRHPNVNFCYYSSDFYNPWFKLDLGRVIPITRIMFILPNSIHSLKYINIEVRVGKENVTESNFSSQKLFGFFPGPSAKNQVVIMENEEPVHARYVTVQRWSDVTLCTPTGSNPDHFCRFMLCHIEINS